MNTTCRVPIARTLSRSTINSNTFLHDEKQCALKVMNNLKVRLHVCYSTSVASFVR